jgi:TIR domain
LVYAAMPDAQDTASHPRPIEVFYAYSHKDEALRDELETHLSILRRMGVISGWHDRRISGGMEWNDQISEHLNKADLILLLVSSDFINSEYCWNTEMTRAMQRHQLREARVIPIILRDCVWDSAPFSKLQALPRDGKPVKAWASQDEAFKNIALGIRSVAEELGRKAPKPWGKSLVASATPPTGSVAAHKKVSPIRDPRDLLLYGPRLKIMFGPPILRPPAATLPGSSDSSRGKFLLTDALLDPGAGRTVLTPEAVQRAGLTKIGETTLSTVGGHIKAGIYAASLQFPGSGLKAIEVIEICCCEILSPLFYCLLGRDVLSRWIFNYDGPAGTWQIMEAAVSSWVEPPEGSDLLGE